MKGIVVVLMAISVRCVLCVGAESRPNIVFILADDFGYMDLTAYAAKVNDVNRSECYYETPNLDRLADQGVAFTQAYANQLCSPSRASILTGHYHCRLGVTTAWFDIIPNYYNQGQTLPTGYHPLDSDHKDQISQQQAWLNAKVLQGLPSGTTLDQGRDEICLPEVLKDYESVFIGKWHLGAGGVSGYQPDSQGFGLLAHFDSGACSYFNWHQNWQPGSWKGINSHKVIWDETRNHGSWKGLTPANDDYLTDSLTRLATDFLRQYAGKAKQEKPFLLYFSHFSVHGPYQAREKDIAYFEKKTTRGWNGQDDPVYAGMVKALDDSVGQIVAALKETQLLDNTIIVFFSDNGGLFSNAPLRNTKAFLHEGGIRVPLIIRLPGDTRKSGWCDEPVHAVDLLPTLSELTGHRIMHKIDGQSLVSLLKDPSNQSGVYQPHPMVWHYPFNVKMNDPETNLPLTPHSAIRDGDYKLIWDWHGRLSLYNLAEDIGEKNNLADSRPELTKELFRKLVNWLDENVERRYFPTPNPDYDAQKDARQYPFRDLRKELLGLISPPGLPDGNG